MITESQTPKVGDLLRYDVRLNGEPVGHYEIWVTDKMLDACRPSEGAFLWFARDLAMGPTP